MTKKAAAPTKIFGQDINVLLAVWANVLSWIVRTFAPSLLPRLVPAIAQEDVDGTATAATITTRTRCIVVGRPGGVEQLRVITLKPRIATCGYNVPGQSLPFTKPIVHNEDMPNDCVLIRNHSFSVNYADCCIRWGLYESAKQFVGYPIVPGFDVAGVVERVGSQVKGNYQPGDRVYGASLFGAYSSRVLVPEIQIRKIPDNLSFAQAASLPAVSLTALYALFLAGHFPTTSKFLHKGILIHSAAGGVGSMLIQMSKILKLSPIVGVVGRSNKVEAAKLLGCNVVIDKSSQNLWDVTHQAAKDGYSVVMDSNGVSTLEDSYNHLCATGRLIVFGFHTNLPMGKDMLSPIEWLKMAWKMRSMPKFDPMAMGAVNKSVLAFNLSFFAEEREMVSSLFDQVHEWIQQSKLECPKIVEMSMDQIADAHNYIQSGTSIGKIILTTGV